MLLLVLTRSSVHQVIVLVQLSYRRLTAPNVVVIWSELYALAIIVSDLPLNQPADHILEGWFVDRF